MKADYVRYVTIHQKRSNFPDPDLFPFQLDFPRQCGNRATIASLLRTASLAVDSGAVIQSSSSLAVEHIPL